MRILTVAIAAVLPRELYQLSVKVGGVLEEIGVLGMRPAGTCTRLFGCSL